MATHSLTQDRLKNLLHYDPETGVFTWRVRRGGRNIGDRAGKQHSSGYWNLFVDGKWLMAHRAAWLYSYGTWPVADIDHINRIRNDNRLCNLREANRSENCQNQPIRKSNTSGITGVSWHKGANAWVATISVDKKLRHLGTFRNIEDAVNARRRAETVYYPFKAA